MTIPAKSAVIRRFADLAEEIAMLEQWEGEAKTAGDEMKQAGLLIDIGWARRHQEALRMALDAVGVWWVEDGGEA